MVWRNLGLNPGLAEHWRTLYPQGHYITIIYVCVCVCVYIIYTHTCIFRKRKRGRHTKIHTHTHNNIYIYTKIFVFKLNALINYHHIYLVNKEIKEYSLGLFYFMRNIWYFLSVKEITKNCFFPFSIIILMPKLLAWVWNMRTWWRARLHIHYTFSWSDHLLFKF